VSKSFELYYRQIVALRGLPFELQIPNEKTMKAIENSRRGKGKTFFLYPGSIRRSWNLSDAINPA
jgi:antitoxin component of RelBE/YafQ-DinJ toxin-antitoxin module